MALTSCKSKEENDLPITISEQEVQAGKKWVAAYGCINCHQIPGVGGLTNDLGPPLGAWSQQKYIAGRIPNTPENLTKWLLAPHGVEKETAMPDLNLSPAEARSITIFLFSLK